MQCSNKIYHQNEFGSARKCECQGALHITFGTISVLLSRQQVGDFATYVANTLVSEYDVEDRNERCIYLPTRDFYLMFALTYNELQSLSEILDQTILMMQVEDVLEKE